MRKHLLFSFILGIIIFCSCDEAVEIKGPSQLVKDDYSHIKINIPEDWSIKNAKKSNSFLRISSFNKKKTKGIFVYSIKLKDTNEVNRQALTDNISKYLKIGKIIESPDSHGWIQYFYDESRKLYTSVYYKKDRNFGYYILYQSNENDLKEYEPYLLSTQTNGRNFYTLSKKIIIKISIYLLIPAFFIYLGNRMKKKRMNVWWTVLGGLLTPFITIPIILYFDIFDGNGFLLYSIFSLFFINIGYSGMNIHFEDF